MTAIPRRLAPSPFVVAATLLTAAVMPALAQSVGSLAAERARLVSITHDSSLAGNNGAPPAVELLGVRVTAVLPSVQQVWNSAIPFSLNDGPMWAGRGTNASINGGFDAQKAIGATTLHLVVAPTLYYSANAPFPLIANRTPGRSGWANPFHGPDASLDLPLRFGDRPILGVDPGNSTLEVRWPAAAFGVTTASEWWGPGIRNAIVLSNNAPGIPRYFIRTAHPIQSRAGWLDAEWIAGSLTQSRFFSDAAPQYRTLSGLRVQFTTAFDSGLTFGLSRMVYAPDADAPALRVLQHAADVLTRWEIIGPKQKTDQIAALSARWVIAPGALEIYGEWARMDLPHTAAELLTAPHATGGYTLGVQWLSPRRHSSWLRLQSEVTYLEQSIVFASRPTPDFYSGRASPQGYTQRGQVIGAAIGPGGSSQFLALDWVAPRWQAGAYLSRIRWDNDALYRELGTTFFHHDVSLLPGARGAWRTRRADFTADVSVARRDNYLFQNGRNSPPGFRTVDVRNITITLAATPR
ncbi:MAG TPA: capsule assembly Wzi family protein [Gemmatimonadaceae bacterium]